MKLVLVLLFLRFGTALAQKECTTPDLKPGTCVPLRDCQIVLDLIEWLQKQIFGTFKTEENLKNYLSRSQCGYDDKLRKPLVCCQSWKTSHRATTSTTLPPAEVQSHYYDPVDDSKQKATKDFNNHPNIALINGPDCGVTSSDRIINGNQTELFELPWMVLLSYQQRDGSSQFSCGGTLISPRYVLTAAHCVTDLSNAKLVSVRLGEHDLKTTIDCETFADEQNCAPLPQDIAVERVVIHRDYEKTTIGDDIALVRLALDADMTDNVKPICLPATRDLLSKSFDKMTVAGWGITESGRRSDVLLKAVLPVLSADQCNKLLQSKVNARFLSPVTPDQLCAGGGDADSDRGDSGGPLQTITQLNAVKFRYVQFGIVSFGYKPTSGVILPAIFTRVSSYMSWILDNMAE